MTLKGLLLIWDQFWFTERSPAPICLFRILFGLLVMISSLMWAPDLYTLFGQRGVVSIETMRAMQGLPRFSLLYLFPSDQAMIFFYICLCAAAAFVATGLFTRFSTIALFLLLVSFDHRNPLILNSGDTFLRIAAFILMLSPAGAMFSIDRLLAGRKGLSPADPWSIELSIWAQRLLQLEVAAVYCQTFWAKVIGETWWNGTAVYYATRLEELYRLPVPYLFDHLWTCKLLCWGTLLIELALWTLIWIRDFRYYVLLAGVALHLGIDYALNLPLFSYIMIASYAVFIEPSDLKRAIIFAKEKTMRIATLVRS